jgi:flagellar protein FlgJ
VSGQTPTAPIDLFRTFSLESQKAGQPVDRAKVVQLAQEFEGMLMLQMVRQMRQSLLFEDQKEEGFGNETMTDTFDVEFSRYLAKAGGIGVGAMIERQLTAQTSGASTSTPAALPAAQPAATAPGTAAASSMSPLVAAAAAAAAARAAASASSSTSDPALTMPLDAETTSHFGWRRDPLGHGRKFHSGVDLRAAYGTDVPAAAAGEVTFAGDQGTYGTLVVLKHEDGMETRYAHLSSAAVKTGERVEAGQVVGQVGSTGRSTAPHLHFEVRRNGQQLDPEQVATGPQAATFKFVSGIVDSLHERMSTSDRQVSLTDDLGADNEDPGRTAR